MTPFPAADSAIPMDFKIDATLTNEYLRFSRHTSNFLRDFRCIVAISMPPNAASPASVASAGVLSEKAMRRPVDETLLRKSPSVAEALNLSVPLTSDRYCLASFLKRSGFSITTQFGVS